MSKLGKKLISAASNLGPDFYLDNTKMGCQATFKEHCQYPKCDCDDPNLDPIQNKCKYGWVLPDRCRYNPRLGCDCGAYPAMKWDGKKYVSEKDPRTFPNR